RDELLARPELVDVAVGDVLHRVAVGDRDAEAVEGNGPPRVQRAVDRVDDHAKGGITVPEGHRAPLLRDGGELMTLAVERLELVEDSLLAEAVDGQRPVTARADVLVLGALGDGPVLLEDPLLDLHGAAAGRGPLLVGGADRGGGLSTLPARGVSHRRPSGRGYRLAFARPAGNAGRGA